MSVLEWFLTAASGVAYALGLYHGKSKAVATAAALAPQVQSTLEAIEQGQSAESAAAARAGAAAGAAANAASHSVGHK